MYTAEDARRLLPFARRRDLDGDDLEQGRLRRRRRQPFELRRSASLRRADPRDAADARPAATSTTALARATARTRSRPSRYCSTAGCPSRSCGRRRSTGAARRRPREWMFVKRVLDRRPAVILAHRGAGVDHTTAAANIAALVEVVAARAGRADPEQRRPGCTERGRDRPRDRAARSGTSGEEVLLDGDAIGNVGLYPWDAGHPIVLDTSAALALGYRPVGDYAATVVDDRRLARRVRARRPRRGEAATRRRRVLRGSSSTTPRRIASWRLAES